MFSLLLLSLSLGQTHYLAPAGLDTNDGLTRATAWRTLNASIPKVGTNATLVLLRGQYAGTDSTCQANQSGLTIVADEPRQAELTTKLTLRRCDGVTVQGLTLRDTAELGELGRLLSSFTIRGNLFVGGQYQLTVLATGGRIEENEFREYTDTGINGYVSNGVVARNFFVTSSGGTGILLRFSDCLVENNVTAKGGYSVIALGERTRIRGNLFDSGFGILLAYDESSTPSVRHDNVIENNVVITQGLAGDTGVGIAARFVRDLTVARNTIISPLSAPAIRFDRRSPDAGAPGTLGRVEANYLVGHLDFTESVSATVADNDVVLIDGGVARGATGQRQLLVDLRGCLASPPDDSPLRTLASDGGPLGASVLFLGAGTPADGLLWEDGGFPCGPELVANSSPPTCSGIAARWGVDLPSCRLPRSARVDGGIDGGADAGTTDAGNDGGDVGDGGPDAGTVDAGAADAGSTTSPRFVSVPSLIASCGTAYRYEVRVDPASAVTLESGPSGATLTNGVLEWSATTGPTASFVLTVPGSMARQSFVVNVDCSRSGCGCTAPGHALGLVLSMLVVLRRTLRG